jgi:chemotaxis protein histidine kinase CheA
MSDRSAGQVGGRTSGLTGDGAAGFAGIDDSRLRRAFLEEADELSQKLGESLVALDGDRGSGTLVHEVFRLTHSLKSESALM